MLVNWIIFGLLCLASSYGNGVRAYDHEISEQRDHKVLLSCPIDFKNCGELHSVKWFKGNTRIAVVSGDGEVATVKDEYMSRMSIDHSPKGPVTSLSIKSLQIADEDVYTCESTFLEPRESCDTSGVYRIDLKVEVPPSAVHILDEHDKFVKNGTKYGPLREGHQLKSICEVKATRPVPTVAWYRGGKRLTDSLHVDEENGLYYVKSELLLILSRLELGNTIECRVESPSLDDEIITNHLVLDLEVPPTNINLTGVEHHTVQGTNVLLQCKVYGARPAVTVRWFNSTREIDIRHSDGAQIETKSIEQRDGTYETISDLKFVATRYEDSTKFRCEAENIVMRENKDKPLHQSLVLEVLYPPVVTVKPENLTETEGNQVLLLCEYEANPATLQSVKWYQNGKLLNLPESDRYEGGNPEHTALLIKKSTRNDDGVYTCELENVIGSETSDNEIYLEVQFPPVVNLTMDPDTPMIENDEGNATLYCNVLEGNPPTLTKVRWFLGGYLLKELPECNDDGTDELCNIDPSRLLLQSVGRQFLGNYSCEGLNSAGWGARSKESELIVYYEPGNATIRHNPQIAVKRSSVNFTCSVDDPGFPAATTYRWLRGGRVVHEVTSNLYTVDPVGLDSCTNFTCYAFNAGGNGTSATVLLDVHAAPAFINPLMPYTGVLFSTDNASLTCRVECVPECSISWFKDGLGIDDSSHKYFFTEKYLDADPATGDFKSMLSILNFNMTAWPQGKFDIYADNANYSCVSTNNSAGHGVRSTTYFGIEYPPENTTVSKDVVTVEEDNIPERILCTAKGNPEPLYEWQFNGSVITRGSALIINHKMAKSDAGAYECFSYNKHGRHSAVTNITVTYKPTCEIVRKEIDDEDTLFCTANGNPKEADFQWSIKSENDSIELGSGRIDGESSYLILDDEFSVTRIYRCIANNSVGAGPYCQIEVAGHLSWWQRWDKITLIILVTSIIGVLLAVIVLCCVIICICRRRRRRDKYHTDVSISATQSVLSYQASPPPLPPQNTPIAPHRATPEIPKSPPKWPLRPGVMVHVKGNTKQNMCANRSNLSPQSLQAPQAIALSSSSLQAPSASLLPSSLLPASALNASSIAPAVSQNPNNLSPNRNNESLVNPLSKSSSLSQPPSTLVVPLTHSTNDQNGPVNRENLSRDYGQVARKCTCTNPVMQNAAKPIPCRVHIGTNNNILTGRRDNDDDVPPPLPKRNILPPSRNSTNANNISECSTNELLPRKSKKHRNKGNLAAVSDNDDDGEEENAIGCRPLQEPNDVAPAQDEQDPSRTYGSTTRGTFFERIFGEIFTLHGQSQQDDNDNGTAVESRRTIRDHFRNFFGKSNILRRHRLERCDSTVSSNTFATEHRLKGIRCSGVITYKKTPLTKPRTTEMTDDDQLGSSSHGAAVMVTPPTPRNELNNNNRSRKINNKSSALGDPLTEPGEYENLPFHGLQTAPNKFATTPSINFNNPNVVRVAPRPKQNTNLANNTSSYMQQQQHHQQSHYPLAQSNAVQKQSYPLSTSQTLLLSSTNNNGHSGGNCNSAGHMTNCSSSCSAVGGGTTSAGHSRQYSLSNCFPTSYTSYYQQQQTQKGSSNAKNTSSDSCSFTNNCPPYTVQSENSSANSHNPFIVQNLRKFNTNSGCRQNGAHRKKPPDPEKRFYSLKSLGNRKGSGLHFCSIKPSLSSKCKRHHSFAGGSVGDIVTSANCISIAQHTLPFTMQQHNDLKMKFYEPPLYENLTDSIQIHESSLSSSRPYNKHPPHPAHDDVNNLMEPERLSIYRSDSGISNSSYECVTPVPAPRQLLKQKSSSLHSSQCKSQAPLYMNVANSSNNSCTTEKTAPTTALLPSMSSAAASAVTPKQQQKHPSSCPNNIPTNFNCNNSGNSNGNGSHCNGANKCNQPNNNNSKDIVQSYCQRQQQHQQHHQALKQHHPQNQQQQQQSHHHHQQHQQQQKHLELHAKHGSSNRNRCKKRAAQNSASLLSLEHVPVNATNPFLTNGASSSSGFNSLNEQGGGASSSSSSSTTTTNRCRPKPQQQKQILVPKDHSQILSLNATTLPSSSTSSSKHAFNPVSHGHRSSTSNNSRTKSRHMASSNLRTSSPQASAIYHTSCNSDNDLTDSHHYNEFWQPDSHRKSNGYIIRPMKLPLRKHHSFHFQPSQTVAGRSSPKQRGSKNDASNSISNYRTNYKLNGGPLVFKPLLNENSAFKPITPATSSCSRDENTDSSHNTPRICGTSLKRHMSNVESYDRSRYKKFSLSSPGLNIEDEQVSRQDNDTEDNIHINDNDDDDEDIDEIILTQEEDPPSSSSNSTIVGKHLVYADLASLNTNVRSNRNLRSISTNANSSNHCQDEFDDLTINSDSEQFRRSNSRFARPVPFYGTLHSATSGGFSNGHSNESSILGTPIKRRTQYTPSLNYNEPLSPADLADDLDYADVDYRSYGPINYKAASIYALVKKQKNNGALKEVNENNRN